jgi:uncharacterized protein YjbJ (UPF0337 family)
MGQGVLRVLIPSLGRFWVCIETRGSKRFGRRAMNWDQVEGKWKQYKGQIKEKWGKLTDDDIEVINGKRQQLVGKIQQHYGLAREAAEKQADEFVNGLKAESREEGKERERARRAGEK